MENMNNTNNAEKKTIYLHIGQPKTGTSSIQKYCVANTEVLKANGICYELMPYVYPNTRKQRNGRFLTADVTDENGKTVRGGKEERMKEAFEIIKGQLEEYHAVLLTDERLWNYLPTHDYDSLKELKKFADGIGARVVIMAYLRPQDAWIASLYRQRIQAAKKIPIWDEYIKEDPDDMATDYAGVCDDLARIVGKENLILRVYDRKCFPGGKIETDFFDALGITDLKDAVDLEAEINPSLTNNYAELMRILNFLDDEDGLKIPHKVFEDACISLSKKTGKDTTSLLSDEQRLLFKDRYGEGNEKVNSQYLQKGSLKLTMQSDQPVWDRYDPEMFRATVLLMGQIISKQQKELNKTKKRLDKIEKDLAAKDYIGRIKRKTKSMMSKPDDNSDNKSGKK